MLDMLRIIHILLVLVLLEPVRASPPLLFPPDTQTLRLRYPDGQWISPGANMTRNETREDPIISAVGLTCEKPYLMLFIDLDVLLNGTTATVILHWYQPDLIAGHEDGILKPNGTYSGKPAAYIGPRAPKGTRHRYVYLLFEQPAHYAFPACFRHIFPGTVAARAGFDIVQFTNVTGLRVPVAVNWFWAGDHDHHNGNPPWTSSIVGTTTSTTGTATKGRGAIKTSLKVAPCEETGRHGHDRSNYGYPDSLQIIL